MTVSRLALAMTALAVGVACLCVSTSGAASGWVTDRDPTHGYSISVPSAWQIIPSGRAKELALVAKLRKEGQEGRAQLVLLYEADANQSSAARVFDATQWPAVSGRIATDVIVNWNQLPSGYLNPAGLQGFVRALANQLTQTPGIEVKSKKAVTLAGEQSYLLTGTSPAPGFGGARTGFELYCLLGNGGLFQVEFRTDSRHLTADKPIFGRIATSFRVLA